MNQLTVAQLARDVEKYLADKGIEKGETRVGVNPDDFDALLASAGKKPRAGLLRAKLFKFSIARGRVVVEARGDIARGRCDVLVMDETAPLPRAAEA